MNWSIPQNIIPVTVVFSQKNANFPMNVNEFTVHNHVYSNQAAIELLDRLSDWLTIRLTDYPIDRLSDWLTIRLTDYPIDRLSDWQTIHWQTIRLTDYPIDHVDHKMWFLVTGSIAMIVLKYISARNMWSFKILCQWHHSRQVTVTRTGSMH